MSRRGKKRKTGSQAGRRGTSPQEQKARRPGVTKSVFVLLTVIVAAVAAWNVMSPRGEEPWSPSLTVEPLPSTATTPDDAEASGQATGTPKIVLPETSYDFGTITQGADVSHTFVVRNAGDAPLKLLDVGGP
jgi:hypothetical protein